MTREEALAVLFAPLPHFEAVMVMTNDEWRAFVRQSLEAARVLLISEPDAAPPDDPHAENQRDADLWHGRGA